MPYMQRITWSGIALHAGDLPGYPASHGCIRLKRDFAIRLWHLTRRGARVIIAPTDVRPLEIANPAFLRPGQRSPPTAEDCGGRCRQRDDRRRGGAAAARRPLRIRNRPRRRFQVLFPQQSQRESPRRSPSL